EEAPLPPGPKVLVVNHPTVWDAFPILTWRRRGFVHVTIEDQIWTYTVPRRIFSAGNQIKLDMRPGMGKSAIRDSLQVLGLPNDHSVLFSIEGGQTLPEARDQVRARRGAVLLAMEANCPIVPIGVHLPRRNILRKEFAYEHRGRKYRDVSYIPRFRSRYGVVFGEARYPREVLGPHSTHEDYQAYADSILSEVYRLADSAALRIRAKDHRPPRS
ncbi:MAG: 1-acyl-sn-glycerol-3-phosphate acyltransferase, partial [Spirochaetaceae bacterium]|nr:1-acyl-sn-glycerol-3-phosphate acyltransferase [Spirochaetaceae bacterium]